MNTRLARMILGARSRRVRGWAGREREIQLAQLRRLLSAASDTEFGRAHDFRRLADSNSTKATELAGEFAEAVDAKGYECFREDIMKMTDGAPDVLWPGKCRNFAQSSGTSDGRSKFIPVTRDSLRHNHYAGAADSVALYLESNPGSRLFSGKGLILGGSFDSLLKPRDPHVKVGDLSATLIDNINPLAGLFRVPSKKTALLTDWSVKLDALARESMASNVTNISGVPSWMMRVLLRIMELKGAKSIREVWPDLEVFFHGGISFEPYRQEYAAICGPEADTEEAGNGGMHYFENYNASEGFFAVQHGAGPGRRPLRLLLDIGVYYEFMPLGSDVAVGVGDVEAGKVYELVITSCNGLWRYRLGDTIRIESVSPLTFTMCGRTHSFINAFGEELMESNADKALAEAARQTSAMIANYTAAPVYARSGRKGRHQWAIEWAKEPDSVEWFAEILDEELRKVNSDYDAKRSHSIFLDPPTVTTVGKGAFDRWLTRQGNGKLGGQRKIPRLSNDRRILDSLLNQ